MATRQEIFTALNITINTVRVGDFMWSLENTLKDQDAKGAHLEVMIDLEDEFSEARPTTVAELKEFTMNTRSVVKGLCDQIETVLTKTDAVFLEAGFSYWEVNKADIESDISDSKFLCDNCDIETVLAKLDLENLAVPIENFKPKITQKLTSADLPDEINNTNIVHDVTDAMSYELKGLNSYTGEASGRKTEDIKELIEGRVKVAGTYFSLLPSNLDVDLMRSVVSHVEAELPKAFNKTDLWSLGQYLDSNIPKLIMIRRGWAL